MRRHAMAWVLLAAGGLMALAAGDDYAQLAKRVRGSRMTLAQGIARVERSGEEVLSARFEVGPDGRLRFVAWTAVLGTAVEAKRNLIKEWVVDVNATRWRPMYWPITDEADLAEAAQQLAVRRIARASLYRILRDAQAMKGGMILSIRPIWYGRPMFVVRAAGSRGVVETVFDARTGKRIRTKPSIAEPRT